MVGIVNKRPQYTPDTNSFNDSGDNNGSPNGVYQVANGNNNGGGGGENDPEDDVNVDSMSVNGKRA